MSLVWLSLALPSPFGRHSGDPPAATRQAGALKSSGFAAAGHENQKRLFFMCFLIKSRFTDVTLTISAPLATFFGPPSPTERHSGDPLAPARRPWTLRSNGFAAAGHRNHKRRVFCTSSFKIQSEDLKMTLMRSLDDQKLGKRGAKTLPKEPKGLHFDVIWDTFSEFSELWSQKGARVAPGPCPKRQIPSTIDQEVTILASKSALNG